MFKSAFDCWPKQRILPSITKRFNKNPIFLNKNVMNIFLIKRNHIKNLWKRSSVKLFSLKLNKWRFSIDRMLENIHLWKWVNQPKIFKHHDFVHLIKPVIKFIQSESGWVWVDIRENEEKLPNVSFSVQLKVQQDSVISDSDFISKLVELIIILLDDLVTVNHINQVDTLNSTQHIHEPVINRHVDKVSLTVLLRWWSYKTGWYCTVCYFMYALALYYEQVIFVTIDWCDVFAICNRFHLPVILFNEINAEKLSVF